MYSDEEIEKFRQAGKIASEVREYGVSLIKVGASILDVSDKVEAKIIELGGKIAFPAQISLNSIAAHYCAEPDDETVLKDGDVAKLDVGVHIDGFIGDTAKTVDLGNNKELVEASRAALDAALSIIKPGVTLGEIGKLVQETITSKGFLPIANLSGHGVGEYKFHGRPSIPNIATDDPTKLEEGQAIAIEPFASNGAGMIYESGEGNIFSQINRKPVRNMITRKVLKEIESYNNLPFTTRWLTKKFGPGRVNLALRELLKMEVITAYPPLPDRNHGLVSQAEHTVLVFDDPIITTL